MDLLECVDNCLFLIGVVLDTGVVNRRLFLMNIDGTFNVFKASTN